MDLGETVDRRAFMVALAILIPTLLFVYLQPHTTTVLVCRDPINAEPVVQTSAGVFEGEKARDLKGGKVYLIEYDRGIPGLSFFYSNLLKVNEKGRILKATGQLQTTAIRGKC